MLAVVSLKDLIVFELTKSLLEGKVLYPSLQVLFLKFSKIAKFTDQVRIRLIWQLIRRILRVF